MNAKLILAVFATLIATSTAHAGQSFGRDSVYASPSASPSQPSTVSVASRHGRDSVYATGTIGKQVPRSVTANAVVYKPGRA